MINPSTKQRELAYVVRIDRIEPIEGSDNCEAAVVGGWKVMVRKETFKAGELAVYFEIDSKVPETETYAFLAPKHYKVKTQKYTFGGKGNFVSQGLLMTFKDFYVNGGCPAWQAELISRIQCGDTDISNEFLTEILGVTYAIAEDNKRKASIDKYKRMVQRHSNLFKKNKLVKWLYKRDWGKKLLFIFLGKKSDKKGSFWPEWVVKTNEERVQNLPNLFPPDNTEWFVTEKVDGSSTTFTMKRKRRKEYEFYVCSRNVCFDKPEKEDKLFYETNIYAEMAEKYHIEKVLKDILDKNKDFTFVTLQGETYGEGVQKKTYNIKGHDFKAFNLIYGDKNGVTKRLNPREMTDVLVNIYNIPCVPILDEHFILPNTIEEMIAYADGMSVIDPASIREGVVLRTADGVNSFKSVSNNYLIEKGE
jgi:hypothetical protein